MARTQAHVAVAAAALEASIPRQRSRLDLQRVDTDDGLLEGIRHGLIPEDPVARLLAQMLATGTHTDHKR
jgi:hypothetical protein